jgi:putative ABC transport system permease protein
LSPVRVLKGKQGKESSQGIFRKVLIVFQFTISTALIILTFGVKDQLNYIQTKKLGFHKDNVVVMPLRDGSIKQQYPALKNEMLRNAQVENVSASSGLPGRITHHWVIQPEGWVYGEKRPSVWVMMVDHDFVSTLGLEIDKGRDFSSEMVSDQNQGILINESAQSFFGWEDPVGRKIKTENIEGQVVGTVKDFHFQSLRQAIGPIIIYIYPRHFSYLLIRLRGEEVKSGLQSIRQTWKKMIPGRPFEYFFLDQDFDRFYRAEQRAGHIFGGFALLAVIIALLGLFGLTTFTAEQKSKEVGIRKVLGASTPGLVGMFTSEFTGLVLIANMIAWPLAYYMIWNWLQNFVYRTTASIWIFILAAGLTLGLTLITVSVQALRTARRDPVKVLRYE